MPTLTVQDGDDSIDLTVSGGATDTRTDFSEAGTTVVEDAIDADFDGSDFDLTDDGDDTLSIALAGGGGGGSALTVQEDGTELTTDASLFDFKSGLVATNPTGEEIDVATEDGEIDHDALLNFVANEHVDHSGVSITAGTLLTGGGDLTTSRTLNVDEGSISHDGIDQATVSNDDHHTKYTDADAESAINSDGDHGSTASHNYYTDSDAEAAINADADHGSTASHNYFSGSHDDLSNVDPGDHHAQDQSANYKDGGSFEIDAAEFAAGSGTSGQVLQSDGSAASWATAAFSDLSGSASLAQLSAILDASDDIEADHLAAANLPSHAPRHSDGGADELDVADLAGGQGTTDTLPLSDGAAVSWSTAPNAALTNDSVTVTAGDGLKNGGSVALGASTTLDVEPADFAGAGLVDDGSDDLAAQSVSTQTAAYTASENDVVLADASGSAFTVTLPAASTDVRVNVKKTDSSSNAVTIATPGAETIDGQSSITLSAQYASRTIVSDGSNYFIV